MKELVSSVDKSHYLSVSRQRMRTDGRGMAEKKWATRGPKVVNELYQCLHSCAPRNTIQPVVPLFRHRLSSNEVSINLVSFFSLLISVLSSFLSPSYPAASFLSLSPFLASFVCFASSHPHHLLCLLSQKMSEDGGDGWFKRKKVPHLVGFIHHMYSRMASLWTEHTPKHTHLPVVSYRMSWTKFN